MRTQLQGSRTVLLQGQQETHVEWWDSNLGVYILLMNFNLTSSKGTLLNNLFI